MIRQGSHLSVTTRNDEGLIRIRHSPGQRANRVETTAPLFIQPAVPKSPFIHPAHQHPDMSYFVDLFSPATYEAFGKSDRTVTGFRPGQRAAAAKVKTGDKLLCYMTRLSRWVGVLDVIDGPFDDSTPLFQVDEDPFTLRFHVRPSIWLPVNIAVPIRDERVWKRLSFTRDLTDGSVAWTGRVRGSLTRIADADGALIEDILREQTVSGLPYPVDEEEYRRLLGNTVRRGDRDVTVIVPEKADAIDEPETQPEVQSARESIQIQALLAEIGDRMGMQIWIPKSDRVGVLGAWRGAHGPLLERLPLNYDDTTLRTIEQIDVLWLKGRSIRRAFEVEHTTSVYSGILRMADLLALQPNMDIKLHIVAPEVRRDKVHQELMRPVFSLLDRGPLFESCTYIPYDSVRQLAKEPHLAHMSDSVVDAYSEAAED